MSRLLPVYTVLNAGSVSRDFVSDNKDQFWSIYKPLLPIIVVLHFFDALISQIFMSNSENGFFLGSIISGYFMAVLAISWHRVCLHGPDAYEAMDPFKPKRNEISFILAAVFLFLAALIIIVTIMIPSVFLMRSFLSVAVLISLVVIYIFWRFSFYFPAKATGSDVSLKQAFKLSKGYIWRIVFASFFASFYVFLFMIALILLIAVPVALLSTAIQGSGALSGYNHFDSFVINLPFIVYFNPILTVLGITVLSNYYQHSLEQKSVY